MAKSIEGLIDKVAHRRALRRWRRFADQAQALELTELKSLRGQAHQLRLEVDRLCHQADGRLAGPQGTSDQIHKPQGTDWAWRPEMWRGPVSPPGIAAADNRAAFGSELTLFHDCKVSELTLRQIRNSGADDLAPYALRMDVFKFDGSFLSLVLDLPNSAIEGLRRKHLIGLITRLEVEKPLEIFARLNIRHGPNTEQQVREVSVEGNDTVVEFDLAYTELNEKRVEAAWIDLIFEGPAMNQVVVRDLALTRRPRAEL